MIVIKKMIYPILFFSAIFISSCILFSSKNYLKDVVYSEKINATDVNFFGNYSITKSNDGSLQVLLNKDIVQCVVYNKNKKDHLYTYQKINDTTHLLVSKQFWGSLSRYSETQTDSVLYKGNNCVRKKGYFSSKTNRIYQVTDIEAFKEQNGKVSSYGIPKSNLINFRTSSVAILIEDFKEQKNFVAIQGLKDLHKETFFRERITKQLSLK